MARLQTSPAARPRSARRLAVMAGALILALTAAGCGLETERRPPQRQADGTWDFKDPEPGLFGGGGLFGGPSRAEEETAGGTGLNVNAFLWRASLDTTAFMPLASADPFGGVIITDWYSPQANPGERFKVNVFILGRQLRADALKVSVFRQVRDASGAWVDTPVADSVATDFENAVLTRARQMRIAAAGK